MSALKKGFLARAVYRAGAWLAANWADGKTVAASTELTIPAIPAAVPAPALAVAPLLTATAPLKDLAAPQFIPVTKAAAETESLAALRPVSDFPRQSVADVLQLPVLANVSGEPAVAAKDDAPAHSQDFRFAARLAAVSKLNAPSSRAARRSQTVAPVHRAVPLLKAPEIKVMKETRLPTAFAARGLSKKAKPSAEIIDLSIAKTRTQAGGSRRAA